MMNCSECEMGLSVTLDGEATPEIAARVAGHLAACADCRGVLEDYRRVGEAMRRESAAPAPEFFRRRMERLVRGAPSRTRWLAAAAAAILVAALFLFVDRAVDAPVPALLARAVEWHDRVARGGVTIRRAETAGELDRYFASIFGAAPPVPPAAPVRGGCCCDALNARAVPWVVYDHRGVPVSFVAVPGPPPELPASARRKSFSCLTVRGRTVMVCGHPGVTHLWIAALPERDLLEAVMGFPEGRADLMGIHLPISGVVCAGCCALAESAAKCCHGVREARVDLRSMELILVGDGVDLDAVRRALEQEGFGTGAVKK